MTIMNSVATRFARLPWPMVRTPLPAQRLPVTPTPPPYDRQRCFYAAFHRAQQRLAQRYAHASTYPWLLGLLRRTVQPGCPLPSGATLSLAWLHQFDALYTPGECLHMQVELTAMADDFLRALRQELTAGCGCIESC